MPEPIVPPSATPPAEDPNKGLASILEGLGKLSDTVSTITERLDTFDETLEGIKQGAGQPAAPATPAPGAPAAPTWKPKTWDEFPQKAEEIAGAVVDKKLKEREDAAVRETEEAKKQAEQLRSQIDEDFDRQFEALEKGGAIPSVADVKDPNDPGKVVRKELFALGIKYNSPDLVAMAQLRDEWVKNGYTLDLNIQDPSKSKWIKSNPSPFGAGAPVASSSRSAASKTGPTYKEIHSLSMDEMIRRYNA